MGIKKVNSSLQSTSPRTKRVNNVIRTTPSPKKKSPRRSSRIKSRRAAELGLSTTSTSSSSAKAALDFDKQQKKVVQKEKEEKGKGKEEKKEEKGKGKEEKKEEPKNPQLALLEAYGTPIQGKNVSGRKWKQTKKGSSSHVMNKNQSTSWSEKQKQRSDRRDLQEVMKEGQRRKQQEKEARTEAWKRKQELKKQNELKGMQFQVIRDTTKINKMSRKQKKLLMKMDTTNM